MVAFVDFDDDEGGNECQCTDCLDNVVDASPLEFVSGGCGGGWLED